MSDLYTIVKSLQAAKGSIEKQAILDANKDNALFKAYMKATYDVGLSYYMKKLPVVSGSPGNVATMDQESIDWFVEKIAGRFYTGKAAEQTVKMMLAAFDAEGQELTKYIFDRSIGASVGDTMVLKTWPDLYFIPPYMRCASMSEKAREAFAEEESFYVQTKRDGSFAYGQRSFEGCRLVTRQGGTYPIWFADRMTSGLPYGMVLIGEMEVYVTDAATNAGIPKLMSRKDGNGVLNSVLKGADESEFDGYEFKYVAWDTLTAIEFADGKSDRPLIDRWLSLEYAVETAQNNGEMLQIELSDNVEVKSVAEAKAIHLKRVADGCEGTVWKRKMGIWKDTSSGTMDAVKVKVVAEAEFKIVGSYEGTGKAKGMLGGITVETECGKLRNNCGSGFSDDQRKSLWLIRDNLPGNIATLEFNDITTARGKTTVSLSLPIFIEIRFDRTKADTLERVYEQFEAAKKGGAA
jgi:hypothetical protein